MYLFSLTIFAWKPENTAIILSTAVIVCIYSGAGAETSTSTSTAAALLRPSHADFNMTQSPLSSTVLSTCCGHTGHAHRRKLIGRARAVHVERQAHSKIQIGGHRYTCRYVGR